MAPELLNIGIVEETLMPVTPGEQIRSSAFVIQKLEALVDKIFRKYHLPTPPPTVRFRVVEEFRKIEESFKVA
jgi:hypothetical protein